MGMSQVPSEPPWSLLSLLKPETWNLKPETLGSHETNERTFV